ncbi:MAG: hypothetical protein WD688_23275 [Candidatus Binatia bacterium]
MLPRQENDLLTRVGAVRKFLLQCVNAAASGKVPPHVIFTPEQNDLRHVACIVAKIPSTQDPKQFVAEQLKKEKYWESAHD